jgi:hypothetical protein
MEVKLLSTWDSIKAVWVTTMGMVPNLEALCRVDLDTLKVWGRVLGMLPIMVINTSSKDHTATAVATRKTMAITVHAISITIIISITTNINSMVVMAANHTIWVTKVIIFNNVEDTASTEACPIRTTCNSNLNSTREGETTEEVSKTTNSTRVKRVATAPFINRVRLRLWALDNRHLACKDKLPIQANRLAAGPINRELLVDGAVVRQVGNKTSNHTSFRQFIPKVSIATTEQPIATYSLILAA